MYDDCTLFEAFLKNVLIGGKNVAIFARFTYYVIEKGLTSLQPKFTKPKLLRNTDTCRKDTTDKIDLCCC